MLVDSHCHLDYVLEKGDLNSVAEIIRHAKEHDVTHMLCIAVDNDNIPKVLAIAEQYDNVFASVGIHPNDAAQQKLSTDKLLQLADHEKVIAFGETGLDYFRSEQGAILDQKQSFIAHINAAKEAKKPLVIHSRDAFSDTFKVLEEHKAQDVGGIIHCFSGGLDDAKRAIDLGFYISFSGIVTFKNALEIQTVAATIPLKHILVETDSPYLAPVPYRGKQNYPGYTKYVAKHIAALRGVSYEEIAAATTANFCKLFNIDAL
jgi:TatD DNase family protein